MAFRYGTTGTGLGLSGVPPTRCRPFSGANQAESFFSRLRSMVRGQHHFVSPQQFHQYAAHAARLENHSREDNGAVAHRALGLALGHKVSPNWKGYWRRAA